MAKHDFIRQLGEIKKKFLKHAKENSHKIDNDTFEINICNDYLIMRIECENKYGDCVVFEQEIEMDNFSDEIYQKPLRPLDIEEYN